MVDAPAPSTLRPWSGRSHGELAELVRELLLVGHLIDRSGMPHLISRLGREGMAEVAIDEWMAASPIYTKRLQRLLGFEGETVEVVFKGMQFDIGAPPEFLDFRYIVHDDDHGEFQLAHCGALMDVEPMGEEYVRTMCHDIEDPTFDATAIATNPRARMTPVHRPPRKPVDRLPHCAWSVTIDHDADPLPFPAQAERLSTSQAAGLPMAERPADLPSNNGADAYDFPLDSDLTTERFSSATLAATADEICLQQHLLARAFLLATADRVGPDEIAGIGVAQATGIAGLGAKRLGAALGVDADLAGVAAVLEVHPLLAPRAYVATEVKIDEANSVLEVSIGACPALNEVDGLSWPALVVEHDDKPLRAIVQAIAPTATVERLSLADTATDGEAGERARWRITVDPDAEPAPQTTEVTLAEFSTGANFTFKRRG
ncbi:MAG: hypothetical protein KDB02_00675 [Acidimicrobiales bacterium]|nr:hypothetical protein [Acidimicrobiales bacterium]